MSPESIQKPTQSDIDYSSPLAMSFYMAFAIVIALMLIGGKVAIAKPFIPGAAAETFVCLVVPALLATLFCVIILIVRFKRIKSGVPVPNASMLKVPGLFLFLWLLSFASMVVVNYAGPVRCLAYLGELRQGTKIIQEARLERESHVKGFYNTGLAHVVLLDEQRSEFFGWQENSIFKLMSCPNSLISITGYVTIFGMVVQDVQCSAA